LLLAALGQSQTNVEFHPQRILVKFANSDVLKQANYDQNTFNIPILDQLNRKNQLVNIKGIHPKLGFQTFALEFKHPIDITRTIYSYYDTNLFEFVEPDYKGYGGGEIIPEDSAYKNQWGLHNDGTFSLGTPASVGADIDMQKAWDITTGSDELVIAILDSGAKLDHPEYADRLWEDESGFHGWDFANDDNLPDDDHGHGTNVLSIIGANSNDDGVAGVNWKSQLMVVKILNEENFGYYSWWASAIYFATDNGAQLINMSVGGSSYSAVMEDAINYATDRGVTIVACMMNENNSVSYYPAAYENTIAVGATNPDDTRADKFPWNQTKGSNFGPHIDLSAPGNYIYGLHYLDDFDYNSYWSGTSQATPYVTGVASLLLSIDPDLTLESIRSILTSTAEDQVGRADEDAQGFDNYHGHGRLNAFNALTALSSTSVEDAELSYFSLSPNPIKQGEDLLVQFQNTNPKVVTIFDINGQLIALNKTSDDSFMINSGNLEKGVYIIKIQEKGLSAGSSKFIVE
jgi:subtilisin family serine protease